MKARSGRALPHRAGHWRCVASRDVHAAALPWRRSATEWRRQLIKLSQAEPDSAYCNDENFVTNGFQRKLSISRLKSNVPATTFVQGSCSNSQPRLRKITPNIGLSICQSIKDLENFVESWDVDFTDFCGTHSSMLEAKSVNVPKIKVVPYVKYYNFALVISSMQGL